MSISLELETLLDYSDRERSKWQQWLLADTGRLRIPVQPGGRFPTVGDLLEHVFFVERRLLARLEDATPPDRSGVPPGDIDALFEYAMLVRADLRRYVADIDDADADEELTLSLSVGTLRTTRRIAACHVLLHEVRHFAQIALAVRLAGQAPPGWHDILFPGPPQS